MEPMDRESVENEIRKHALINAIGYGGKANPGAVIGKVIASNPELKHHAREISVIVKKIVTEINTMSLEAQKRAFASEFGDIELYRPKGERKSRYLPDLPNATKGGVIMRFAPGPSGPLHIGHTRAAILNDEYVRMYNGKFILRIEDTNPTKIDAEAYDMIPQDLEYLGIKIHHTYIQSDRFDIYYEWARRLLEDGNAYVCLCQPETFRELKRRGIGCEHRDMPVEWQLEQWDRMLANVYQQGEASLVIKTDIKHPNPAVRDFIGFRIVDTPHPRTGERYCVYPLYNFSVAIDDHLMGITHVLRGKDHQINTIKQMYIYDYFEWNKPEFIHYGWVSIEDTVLKTSNIKEGIKVGKYMGWEDPRLGTVRAIIRRGIRPEAIRRYWIEVGIKDVDINFSWETLFAYNKEIVDPEAKRYFFVWDPVTLTIKTKDEIKMRAPLHPDNKDLGYREYTLLPRNGEVNLYISGSDVEHMSLNSMIRLKDMCNIVIKAINAQGIIAEYAGNDLSVLKKDVKIIHAVPVTNSMETRIYMPDGTVKKGYSEDSIKANMDTKTPFVVQFERFGFVNIIRLGAEGIVGYYAHR